MHTTVKKNKQEQEFALVIITLVKAKETTLYKI